MQYYAKVLNLFILFYIFILCFQRAKISIYFKVVSSTFSDYLKFFLWVLFHSFAVQSL